MKTVYEFLWDMDQAALDKRWLHQRVLFHWNNGTVRTGRVVILHARSRQAYIEDDDPTRDGWHQPIEELQLLPEEPEPSLWARWKQHLRALRHTPTKGAGRTAERHNH